MKKQTGHRSLRAALGVVTQHAKAVDESTWIERLGPGANALREWKAAIERDLEEARRI